MGKENEDEIVHKIIEKIGIAPDKQEIREQQNIYQACELGTVWLDLLYPLQK